MSNERTAVQLMASLVQAIKNCQQSGNTEWEQRHGERLKELCDKYLPDGAGFDSGTNLIESECTSKKLVFDTAYHHMNDAGYYDGWTYHRVTVTPAFDGIDIKISGRDRNDIKDYIHESFYHPLTTLVPLPKQEQPRSE